jgi:hypothetical protein
MPSTLFIVSRRVASFCRAASTWGKEVEGCAGLRFLGRLRFVLGRGLHGTGAACESVSQAYCFDMNEV